MKIKLIMKKPLSYFFHGPVTLSNLNNIDNPFEIELDTLSKQDIIGINRAHNTDVISIIEGLEEFKEKLATFSKTKKEAILGTVELTKEENEVVKTVIEPVVETVEEPKPEVVEEQKTEEVQPVETVVEDVEEDKVEEVETKEEAPKATPRRRTTTKK